MRSKKPSATKPPDGTVFFIDRSLGVGPIRTVLVNSGLVVRIHDELFARDEEDRVWLRAVGERGWVVLTKDQKLRYRPLEVGALRASKARVFVLTAGNVRGIETAEVFLAALPRIFRILNSRPRSFRRASFTIRKRYHHLTTPVLSPQRRQNRPCLLQ